MFDKVNDKRANIEFEWVINDTCNFDCPYCFQKEHNKGEFHRNNLYKAPIIRLQKIKEPFIIHIMGGEPTLHPELKNILLALSSIDKCLSIELISNITISKKKLEELTSIKKVNLHASFHPSSKIIFNIDKLLNIKNCEVDVCMMPEKQYYKKTLNFILQLEQFKIKYFLNFLEEEDWYQYTYPKEFYNFYKDRIRNGIEIKELKIKHYINNQVYIKYPRDVDVEKLSYKGMMCQKSFFSIDMKGRIFNACDNIDLPLDLSKYDFNKMRLCTTQTCGSYPMYHFLKERR